MTSSKNKITCVHFSDCSGCLFNENADKPPVLLEAKRFFELQGASAVRIISGPVTGWRCRAKLSIRGTPEHPLVGLYKEDSHQVIDIPFCQVHHPAINAAADVLRAFIRQEKIVPYNEVTDIGELRYVQLVVQRESGRIQCSLVVNAPSLDDQVKRRWEQLTERLQKNAPDLWHSLWINTNSRRDNVIFGPAWHCCWGERWLWERIDEVELAFTPATFGQANLGLFESMLRDIRSLVTMGSRLAEFYGGVGTIGLNMASKCESVRCCEVNPFAEACYHHSKERLPKELADRFTFKTGDAAQYLDWIDDSDLVIVDPPRKGIDEGMLKALTREDVHLRRLIYVSCGWIAFQRACEALLAAGWHIKQASIYILFPGTNQIELMVCFDHL